MPTPQVLGSMWNRVRQHYIELKKYQKALIIVSLVFVLPFVLIRLPSPLFDDSYATTLESREGELLGAMIAKDGQWRFPADSIVPDKFTTCIKMFEDEHFEQHFGINPISMGKAMITNIKAGRIKRGGSTLSMQVIRMSRKNRARTFFEKGIEVVLALKLELFYSKKEILAMYVSHAPFGGNVVGLSAAGWRYFGRSPDKMSWGEAAALAVLPNSPSLVFPGKNEVRLREKRAFLLGKLLNRQVIDSTTYRMSIEEDLPGAPKPLPRWSPRLLTRIVNEGKTGQRIVSTLDYDLQRWVSKRANRYMDRLKHNHIHNAAVLVTEIETGQTVAYVGNVNAGQLHNEQVDIITANRSTGSLLKPFLYAAALDEGLISPKALLPDYPLFYKGFSPKNFDLKYYGAVPANEALTRSLNLPFVNLLIDYGYEKFYEKLKQLGMKSLSNSASHYGLSIILGGAESNLWQLTAMYGNMYRVYQRSIKRPVNQLYSSGDLFQNTYLLNEGYLKGNVELENDKVLSSASIWATIEAMKGLKRPRDYAQWEQLDLSADIAWKTGTSFGFRDAWAVGINGKYVVGVWVGNADGEGRPGLVGVSAAAPLMFDVFARLDGEILSDPLTAETIEVKICEQSGFRAGEHCTDIKMEIVPQSSAKSEVCPYHYSLHLDQSESYQVNSSCYPVADMVDKSWFILPPVQAWYYRQYHAAYEQAPDYLQGCEETGEKNIMSFIYPKNYSKIFIPRELNGQLGKVVFEVAHKDRQQTIYWHVDGEYLGKTTRPHQMGISDEEGLHHLYIIDELGNSCSLEFELLNK